MKKTDNVEIKFELDGLDIETMQKTLLDRTKIFLDGLKLIKNCHIFIDEHDTPLEPVSDDYVYYQLLAAMKDIKFAFEEDDIHWDNSSDKLVFKIRVNESYRDFVPAIYGKLIIKIEHERVAYPQQKLLFIVDNLFILNKNKLEEDFEKDLLDYIEKHNLEPIQIQFFRDKFKDTCYNSLISKTVKGIEGSVFDRAYVLIKGYLTDTSDIDLTDIRDIIKNSDIAIFNDQLVIDEFMDKIGIDFFYKRLFNLKRTIRWIK